MEEDGRCRGRNLETVAGVVLWQTKGNSGGRKVSESKDKEVKKQECYNYHKNGQRDMVEVETEIGQTRSRRANSALNDYS